MYPAGMEEGATPGLAAISFFTSTLYKRAME
jgi:hypothetical protein